MDFLLQTRLKRRVDDPLPDLGAGVRQCPDIVDIERLQARGDTLRERRSAVNAMFQKIPECIGGRRESTRHAHAGTSQLADHFTERCVLAADGFHVRHA